MLNGQLLEMVEKNEVNRALLTLLDENIASAHRSNQVSIAWGLNSPTSVISYLIFLCILSIM